MTSGRNERLAHTRRQLIKTFGVAAGALVSVPLLTRPSFAQVAFTDDPYTLGIAAGDPAPDGFVIWTRLAPKPFEIGFGMDTRPVEVEWEVASDEKFATIVRSGKAMASPLLAHTVHVEVAGLSPGRPYWYRFRAGGAQSPAGKAMTTPAAGAAVSHVRFAISGCQSYEGGLFTAYKHLAAEDPDFVFCYGDYIYENGGRAAPAGTPEALVNRRHLPGEIFSVDDYRRRYAQYKGDPNLQAAHAAAAWFPVWDDHETDNNWASEWDEGGNAPELFRFRRQAAVQAYYEHMPLRRTSLPNGAAMQLYARDIFQTGGLICLSGVALAVLTAFAFSLWRSREAKNANTYGTARWANARDIKRLQLTSGDGVVLGAWKGDILRHDGDEHVLVVAPTNTGKSVGVSLPTGLVWRHSYIALDLKGENWRVTSGLR